jgi:transcriptional regulator of heat shock response
MSLDLHKLSNKLDEALIKETTETLTKFLNDKRMENNKQQTAVDWYANQLHKIVSNTTDALTHNHKELLEQAKEMEKEQIISFGNYCIKQIEVSEAGELLMVLKPEDLYNETYEGGKQ